MKRFLSFVFLFSLIPVIVFAQDIPVAPLDPDVAQITDLVKQLMASVGAGKALGVLGAILAGLAFVLRYGIAVWRMAWIQSRLPSKMQWEQWSKIKKAIFVLAVSFLAIFLGSLLAVGWKAAIIAAAVGSVPMALSTMGINAVAKPAEPVKP